ncbi:YceI family protein [Massilia sp. YIM B04103]|uniref:YceI family protein n=1 Tax=Massilia sp. YIM B04103 TaxID=2963106 RepID=UPI00210BBE2C|nr:YceI family protein [Massilia sp. YIM B04103]
MPSFFRSSATLILSLLLTACVSPPAPDSAPAPAEALPHSTDASFPPTIYRQAKAGGQPVFKISAEDSLLAVTVRRGGLLARLGHDHVVAVRKLEGYAAPGLQRADLRFRLDEMTVDESGLRAEAGLHTEPSADAIAGTRQNMLTRVLDAEHHPWVLLQIQRKGDVLDAAVTLHGVTRSYQIPARVTVTSRGLSASGTLAFKQSDFGITPFAVMGGALAVKDELELRFAVTAR